MKGVDYASLHRCFKRIGYFVNQTRLKQSTWLRRFALTFPDQLAEPPPRAIGEKSVRLNRSQLSLQTLFAVIFVAAFFSRFVARYGIGVLVIVGWFMLSGAITALIVASAVALIDLLLSIVSRSRPVRSVAWTRFVQCLSTGVLAGAVVQGFAVATVFSLFDEPWANTLNSFAEGIKAMSSLIREPRVTQFLTLCPALLAALSFSTARAFANRSASTAQIIAPTGCLLSMIFGLGPPVLFVLWIVIWNRFFRPAVPPPPPPPDRENMLGLLPLAIPLWCAMSAMFGGVLGTTAGVLLTVFSNTQRSRTFQTLRWIFAISMTILAIAAATDGWTGKFLAWWNK